MKITKLINSYPDLKIKKYDFPSRSAVYFICEDNGNVIYIGSTSNIDLRAMQHSTNIDFNSKPIFYLWYPKEKCKYLEMKLINKIKPKFNNHHVYMTVKNRNRDNYHLIDSDKINRLRRKILSRMKGKKINISKLGLLINIHRQTISNLLNTNNDIQVKTIKKLHLICDCLKIEFPDNLRKYIVKK
jgi:hypothetical protein